jgi:hypothetical protein
LISRALELFCGTMKTLLLSFLLTSSLAAFGQGQITFYNRSTVPVPFFTPIYGLNPNAPQIRISGNATTNGGTANYTGTPLLSGSGYTASLWAADAGVTDMGEFQQYAARTFSSNPSLGGTISPFAVTVPWEHGQAVNFQVRVWDNRNGTILTWAEALGTADQAIATGFSDIFSVTVRQAPDAPAIMVGMTSFNLTTPVPEPTTLALALVIAGGCLVRRRLKQAP